MSSLCTFHTFTIMINWWYEIEIPNTQYPSLMFLVVIFAILLTNNPRIMLFVH